MSDKPLNHIAIIPDGNNRWSKRRFFPMKLGYHQGILTSKNVVKWCIDKEIPFLSFFLFSQENWKRSDHEVGLIFGLIEDFADKELQNWIDMGVQIHLAGDLDALPTRLRDKFLKARERSLQSKKLNLLLAINYSGQWDILNACRALITEYQNKPLPDQKALTHAFDEQLQTKPFPPPDLLIRTGKETRISNFFLWQLAYTELYFADCLWPDFSFDHFNRALDSFYSRERRFGQSSKQGDTL